MAYLINIGLVTSNRLANGEQAIPYEIALNVLKTFCTVVSHGVYDSDTEPTLVAFVEVIDPKALGEVLSDLLCQDCIAVYDLNTRKGQLYGEHAHLWGEFNPEYFLQLGGDTLGAA